MDSTRARVDYSDEVMAPSRYYSIKSPPRTPRADIPAMDFDFGFSPAKLNLNPMYLEEGHTSQQPDTSYSKLYYEEEFRELEVMRMADEQLKRRIRIMRLATRVIALLLAIAAFVPLAFTLHKYLTTRHTFRTVNDVSRSAWALQSKPWPTYVYFGVSLVGVFINIFVVAGYARSINTANRAAAMSTAFTLLTLIADVGIWIAAVVIYKYEKEITHNGKHNDLWGWTCSGAAREIQAVFADQVPFDRYCTIQTAGWIAGLLEVGLLLLSLVVYALVYRRMQSKKLLRRTTRDSLSKLVG